MESTVTASWLPTGTVQPTTQPPITHVIPVLRVTYSLLRTFLSQASLVVVVLATPFLILVPLISCIFAPVTLVFNVVLDATIYTPYAIISSVASTLYPLYILCGAACISGAVLGILGRSLITVFNNLIAPTGPMKTAEQLETASMRPRKRRRKGSFAEY